MSDTAALMSQSHQQTLKSSINCVGVGLHGGQTVRLSLLPAPANTGIVFRRTDLDLDIPAQALSVSDSRLCTQISHPDHPEVSVRTVEHVMAALAGLGVDNAIVAVNGPEVPVLDGSAAPFVFLIDCAGRVRQNAPRQIIEILRPVRVSQDEAYAELRPCTPLGATLDGSLDGGLLDMAVSIDFPAQAVGRQALTLSLTEQGFRAALANARTFAMREEIEALRASGLALGGSLENAVVVDGARVLNPEGLRAPDEFVRHKMLDAVGDLALAGAPIAGRFLAHKTGHALNNRLLRALLADTSAWRWTSAEVAGWSGAVYCMAARAA